MEKRITLKYLIPVVCTILVLGTDPVMSEDEPLLEKLRTTFQKDYFSIGILLQTVADFQIDRNLPGYNGFTIANFRLKLYGELDKKFGYLLQTSFINSPSILDAKLYYRFAEYLIVDAGLYKAPFSKEYLTGADAIDFVNRSRIVTVLAPGRQIGLQTRGRINESLPVDYNIGIFNGNGYGGNTNDNNDFLYAARLTFTPLRSSESSTMQLETGINAAFSKDNFSRISPLLNPFVYDALFFTGERSLYGADFSFTNGDFMLTGEYLQGNFDGALYFLVADTSIGSIKSSGFHVTIGYMLISDFQILGRWDRFKADNGSNNPDWMVLGLNYWPSKVSKLQINYMVNTVSSALKYNQILANFQFVF